MGVTVDTIKDQLNLLIGRRYMHSDYEKERRQMKAPTRTPQDVEDSRDPFLSLVSRGNHPELKKYVPFVY